MTSKPKAARAEQRSRRSAARLAAVQALYQHASTGTPVAKLLAEFHDHRLGAEIDGATFHDADRAFFDDIVSGAIVRCTDLDAAITRFLAPGWTMARLDRLMHQLLRMGAYELLARPDVPAAVIISEYVDVARAFYGQGESGFVNALLDSLARDVRAAPAA